MIRYNNGSILRLEVLVKYSVGINNDDRTNGTGAQTSSLVNLHVV